MKVKQLISFLKKKNPDARIVVDGYEDGFDNIQKIFNVTVKKNLDKKNSPNKFWWTGDYDKCASAEAEETAIVLSRKK